MKAARKRLDSPAGRCLLVLSCVLVFTFAFHAKVAAYHHPGHPDTSTASKLWLNGDQNQAPAPSLAVRGFLFVAWFALLAQSLIIYRRQQHRNRPVPLPVKQLNLHRFLRPPPTA